MSEKQFRFQRQYVGGIQAVVLDWSGTTADAYVIAPADVFVEVFKRQGVTISMSEARGPMGLRKDLHIAELAKDPEIAKRWEDVHSWSRRRHAGDSGFRYQDRCEHRFHTGHGRRIAGRGH